MGKSSPSAPPAPDYAAAATAQGAANADAARISGRMSNPNIYGPLGSQVVTYGDATPKFNQSAYDQANQSYNQQLQQYNATGGRGGIIGYSGESGDIPIYGQGGVAPIAPTREQYTTSTPNDQPTVTQTLNPQAQQTLEAQQRVQTSLANLGEQGIGTARNVLGTRFNPNLPGIQTSLDTSGIARMPVNAGMTGQAAIMARLQPQLERQEAATRTRLANQGLTPGGEAYSNAMMDVNQQRNDLLSQAALQGLNLDIGANAQGYNQALQGGQFGNTAQQQSLQQQLALRNQPLNEISGLMSGSQLQMPQFQGYQGQNVAPAPVMAGTQAQGQANMQNYGIQSANVNAQNAGLYGLLGAGAQAAGMAGMFSDRRLKSNIERVGTHPLGIGIYEYDIFGKRQRGVMADEVERVMPEAVIEHPSGFKMVNYGALQ
jgi:hypothetical protein